VLYADPVKVKRYLNRIEREGIARVKVSIKVKLCLSKIEWDEVDSVKLLFKANPFDKN